MNPLLKHIIETVTYHDLFDFPLTAHEIFLTLQGIAGQVQLADVIIALASEDADRLLDSKGGLWYLVGRGEIVDKRLQRYDLAEEKYRIVRRFFRIAKHAPFLRAVFVCNTLSRSNARPESDIDLFVVAETGHVWLTRLFVTGLAALLRKRPTPTQTKDRLCLSFFITKDALDLRSHAIQEDIYLPHWLLDLYPVYDEAGITASVFMQNSWAREALPGLRRQTSSHRRIVGGGRSSVKVFLESILGSKAEKTAKAVQWRRMPERLKESALRGKGVVLTDSILKLHGTDRRAEFRDRYLQRIEQGEYARQSPPNFSQNTLTTHS